jgi:hypothetical protein
VHWEAGYLPEHSKKSITAKQSRETKSQIVAIGSNGLILQFPVFQTSPSQPHVSISSKESARNSSSENGSSSENAQWVIHTEPTSYQSWIDSGKQP